MIAREPLFGCQFIGIGPGTLGVLIAADRLGLLTRILDQGVALVDRLPECDLLGATGLAYAIGSNSRGGELIAGVARDGFFADSLATIWGRKIQAAEDREVRLMTAARFFNRVARQACNLVQSHAAGRFFAENHVGSIVVEPGGRLRTRDAEGQTIAVSRAIVISPGASQPVDGSPRLQRLDRKPDQPVFGSDQLLRHGGGAIVERLRAGTIRRVTIVGGSHSAFSTALTLVRRAGAHLKPGAITIVHKVVVRHFYGSLAEARSMRLNREPLDVCPRTGVVNRFNGLRGEASAFSRCVHAGEEPRVLLQAMRQSAEHAKQAIAEADVLVDATGYDAPKIDFIGANGRLMSVERERGFPVDSRNRLLQDDGTPISGVFVTGLARRYVGANGAGMSDIGAGASVFQQVDGVTIAHELTSGLVGGTGATR
jgi:hypothetical protein